MFREATDKEIEKLLDTEPPPPPPARKRKAARKTTGRRRRRWGCARCGHTSTDPRSLCEPVEVLP